MTRQDMQTIVTNHLTEALVDTTSLTDRLDTIFTTWFQSLVKEGLTESMAAEQEEQQEEQGAAE